MRVIHSLLNNLFGLVSLHILENILIGVDALYTVRNWYILESFKNVTIKVSHNCVKFYHTCM